MSANNPSYSINTSVADIDALRALPVQGLSPGDTAYVSSYATTLVPGRTYIWNPICTVADDSGAAAKTVQPQSPGAAIMPPTVPGRWQQLVAAIA